jgi:methylenetetrahydrofolate reductase (NADPH)
VSSTKEEIRELLLKIQESGIHNVLALRGDRPSGPIGSPGVGDYEYAYQLVRDIRTGGDFCIGAACYPEGHVESQSREEDIIHLREKVNSGVDFLITQLFFDNDVMYDFLNRTAQIGISVPIIVGVMPVTSAKMIKRISALSGTSLTPRLNSLLEKWGDDPDSMQQAGIVHATEQIADLVSKGICGIHIYTMNKPEVAGSITKNIRFLLK